MKLWDRIQRGMEDGFDAALSAVHTITEKAGEGIELTRLRREKARLETQVTRRLAELGNTVYEKISVERLDDITQKLEIRDLLLEIAENEARMIDIDRRLFKELKNDGQDEIENFSGAS
ncbi:MAG: hypothetical protein JW882_04180 [Deltaproteobacteria bacterium]|nr:hypothetical protein [Deltaproteobacteria bacterium]